MRCLIYQYSTFHTFLDIRLKRDISAFLIYNVLVRHAEGQLHSNETSIGVQIIYVIKARLNNAHSLDLTRTSIHMLKMYQQLSSPCSQAPHIVVWNIPSALNGIFLTAGLPDCVFSVKSPVPLGPCYRHHVSSLHHAQTQTLSSLCGRGKKIGDKVG